MDAAHRVHQYMRQTQFSLAARPTQQRILVLAMAMKPFGRNALKLIGSVAVAVPADYRRHIIKQHRVMKQQRVLYGESGRSCQAPGLSGKITKPDLLATGCAGGSSYCTRRSARIRLRDQIESEDSRSCGSTTVPSAVAAFAPAGNCSTVARWPSHKRATSTTCPSGNSSAS